MYDSAAVLQCVLQEWSLLGLRASAPRNFGSAAIHLPKKIIVEY
jgi:hypothetical protein